MKNAKSASRTANRTASKRAKTNSTQMETSTQMGKTTRSHTTRSKNCGR